MKNILKFRLLYRYGFTHEFRMGNQCRMAFMLTVETCNVIVRAKSVRIVSVFISMAFALLNIS